LIVIVALLLFQQPAGQTSFPWHDAVGTMHSVTSTTQLQSQATALADYAKALAMGGRRPRQ
jgi:hypothetical protein